MIFPAKDAFTILLPPLMITAAIAAFLPEWHDIWLYLLIGSGLLLSVDAYNAWHSPGPDIDRQIAGSLSLGMETSIAIRVHNNLRRAIQIQIYDHHPASLQTNGLPQTGHLQPGQSTTLYYGVTPIQRGKFEFNTIQTRTLSPLGLCWHDRKVEKKNTIRVYPSFTMVTQYTLLTTTNRLQQIGIRKQRRHGTGSEFHQLREFREGDSLRQIDWRTTARYNKFISKEYQNERNQNIIMLLDCGRRMQTHDGELSHFDHALSAMLLLTYVALRQGDAIGIGTFSGQPRWVSPIRGTAMLNIILNNIYDLEPSAEAPDYSRAAMDLLTRQCNKHSLVIIITNLREEDSSDLLPALKLLKKKHTVLLANLREEAINNVLHQEINDFKDALTLAATHQYLEEHRQTMNRLTHSGINCLDVIPGDLSVQLVNSYLAMKINNTI